MLHILSLWSSSSAPYIVLSSPLSASSWPLNSASPISIIKILFENDIVTTNSSNPQQLFVRLHSTGRKTNWQNVHPCIRLFVSTLSYVSYDVFIIRAGKELVFEYKNPLKEEGEEVGDVDGVKAYEPDPRRGRD